MARTRLRAVDENVVQQCLFWRARGEMALLLEGKWAGPGKLEAQACAGNIKRTPYSANSKSFDVLRLENENELPRCLCRAVLTILTAEHADKSFRDGSHDINTQKHALFQHRKGDCQAATIGRFEVAPREHNVDTLPIAANHTRATTQ